MGARSIPLHLHAMTTTMLEHLCPEQMYSFANMLLGMSLTTSMEPVVVYCQAIVDPHLAAIVRAEPEIEVSSVVGFEETYPPHSIMMSTWETTRPLVTRIAIVRIGACPHGVMWTMLIHPITVQVPPRMRMPDFLPEAIR